MAPEFFFHGTRPNATFDREPPTGSQPATQQTDPTANNDAPGDPTAAYWQGAYSGTLDGSLNIRWYWSTANPIGVLIRVDAVVTVFADANADGTPQKDKIVGRANVAFSVDPAEPQENISNIPVDGTARQQLGGRRHRQRRGGLCDPPAVGAADLQRPAATGRQRRRRTGSADAGGSGGNGGGGDRGGQAGTGSGVTVPVLPATGGGSTVVLLGAAALGAVAVLRRRS